jgi:hypothetical protein
VIVRVIDTGVGSRATSGGRFRFLRRPDQLPARAIFGIAEDHEGALWLAMRGGVLRLPPGEADRAFADSTYVVRYRSFDQLDGLPGLIFGGKFGPMLARTPNAAISG